MNLTPTQTLILGVLSTRHRLGEMLWTFDARLTGSANSLERLGLVTGMHGIVPKTIRLRITEAGLALYNSPTYTSPLEERLELAEARTRELERLFELQARHE